MFRYPKSSKYQVEMTCGVDHHVGLFDFDDRKSRAEFVITQRKNGYRVLRWSDPRVEQFTDIYDY